MKLTFLLLLLLSSSIVFSQLDDTQSKEETPQSLDSLGTQVIKLMEFYESYDDGSSESQKKDKYEDAVDEMSGETATENDKEDAYKIIDAYISSDKALECDKPKQSNEEQSFDDALKNTEEVQNALEFLDQQETMLMQMSYQEFEVYILKLNPVAGKIDIKTAYNEIHKNDGKHVSFTAADDEMTEAQLQIWAIDAIQNPKDFSEFRKAYKILNPNVTESVILEAWGKYGE